MTNGIERLSRDARDYTVCIMGMGFVGVTLATAMADAGFKVIGVEIQEDVCERLSSGEPHFYEPGLSDHLSRAVANGQIEIHTHVPEHCPATVFIVTVGTPIGEAGRVVLTSIENVSQEIARNLKDGDFVVLRSTVMLGTTRNIVKPILETAEKKFQIAFCPERTVEGQAMAELRYLPQVIGANDQETRYRAAQMFQNLTPTVVKVSDWETAEMIKLIDNAKRDVIFGYANEVARLCDAVGISAAEVIQSGRFGYSRTDLPMPGPVGGPCLTKDSYILGQSMESYGVTPEITLAARRTNERQGEEVADFLGRLVRDNSEFPPNPQISLLGIAFKGRPVTDDVRGTTAKPILESLRRVFSEGEFYGFDPVVDADTIKALGMIPKATVETAFAAANMVLILNNHVMFGTIPIEKLAGTMSSGGVIYDFWNNFHGMPLLLPRGVRYVALGSHGNPVVGGDEVS